MNTIRRMGLFLLTAAMLLVSACSETGGDTGDPSGDGQGDQPPLAEIFTERIHYLADGASDPDQNWADFYLPAGPQKKDSIPLIVMIHGGGWRSEIGADVFTPIAEDLAERGVAVLNVEYRRLGKGGGWPTTFHDVARALDYVVELDKDYPQITTDDELVVGHSAGGQLATWAGTRHKLDDDEVGSRPAFRPTRVISIAGPLDMRQTARDGNNHIVGALGGPPERYPERWDSVDPIRNIDPSIPVAAVHGTVDRVVRPHNSTRYIQTLNEQGGSGRLVLLDGQDHGAPVTPGSDAYGRVIDLIMEYSTKDVEGLGAR